MTACGPPLLKRLQPLAGGRGTARASFTPLAAARRCWVRAALAGEQRGLLQARPFTAARAAAKCG